MVFAEALADLLATGNFVEHVETCRVGVALFEDGLVGVHVGQLLHDIELGQRQRGGVLVGDVDLDTLQIFAGQVLTRAHVVEGLDVDGTEFQAGEVEGVHALGKLAGIDPLGAEQSEGHGVAHADRHIVQLAKDAADGVEQRALGVGDLGRGKHPGQSGAGIVHVAGPALHGHYGEVDLLAAVEHTLVVEVVGQLAGGETVEIGYGELADERHAVVLGEVALDLVAADGVGAVKHHKLLALLGTGRHGLAHRRDEGVRAAAYVLDVIYEHVDVLEHLGRRLAVFAIDGVDLDAGSGVGEAFDVFAGVDVAAHAVLGSVECHQLDIGSLGKDVDGALEVVVDTGGVGDEAHAFALETLEAAVAQHLDAGFDGPG